MATITREEAVKLLTAKTEDLQKFKVVFLKRSTKKLRLMDCERNELHTDEMMGGERAYDADLNKLALVYEVNQGFKSIPTDGLQTLTICGVDFTVEKEDTNPFPIGIHITDKGTAGYGANVIVHSVEELPLGISFKIFSTTYNPKSAPKSDRQSS